MKGDYLDIRPLGPGKTTELRELIERLDAAILAEVWVPASLMRMPGQASREPARTHERGYGLWEARYATPDPKPRQRAKQPTRCEEQGHLWGSWRTEEKAQTHICCRTYHTGPHLGSCEISVERLPSQPFTICLRSGCDARMTLETVLPQAVEE